MVSLWSIILFVGFCQDTLNQAEDKKYVVIIKARDRIVDPNYHLFVFCIDILKSRDEIAKRNQTTLTLAEVMRFLVAPQNFEGYSSFILIFNGG